MQSCGAGASARTGPQMTIRAEDWPIPIDTSIGYWTNDWAWGIPMVALSMVVHALGLTVGTFGLNLLFDRLPARRRSQRFLWSFGIATALAATFLASLHAFEAFLWAAAYMLLGAIATPRAAMLYSMGMMTTTGTANIITKPGWQLMGALEGMAGMLLFGLSTAFLFNVFSRVWPTRPHISVPHMPHHP